MLRGEGWGWECVGNGSERAHTEGAFEDNLTHSTKG